MTNDFSFDKRRKKNVFFISWKSERKSLYSRDVKRTKMFAKEKKIWENFEHENLSIARVHASLKFRDPVQCYEIQSEKQRSMFSNTKRKWERWRMKQVDTCIMHSQSVMLSYMNKTNLKIENEQNFKHEFRCLRMEFLTNNCFMGWFNVQFEIEDFQRGKSFS